MFSGDLVDVLDVFSDRLDAAYRNILSLVFPKLYGENWLSQVQPMTYSDCLVVLKNLSYYYRKGYAFSDWKSFYPSVKKAFPGFKPTSIGTFMGMVAGIPEDRFPAYVHLVRTGEWSKEKVSNQVSQTRDAAIQDASYEVADKVERGVSAIVNIGKKAVETASDALPFYLKPKIIIPVVLGIAILFGLGYSGVGRQIFRGRTNYQKNPVAAAKKKYSEFHGFAPKKTRKIRMIDTKDLVDLGSGLEIGYRSNKWTGKGANYLHKFGKGVRLMCTPDGKHLLLSGGKLGVTAQGIIN